MPVSCGSNTAHHVVSNLVPRGPGSGPSQPGALTYVSCTPSGYCMAIGIRRPDNGLTPIAVAGSGGEWHSQSLPPDDKLSSAAPAQVSCFDPERCMVTLRPKAPPGSYVSGLWDGRSWTTATMPIPSGLLVAKDGLSCTSAKQCLEVAEEPETGFLALDWQGSGWSALPSQPMGSSSGIDITRCVGGGTCMVVASPTPSYATLSGSSWSPVSIVGTPGALLQGIDCVGISFCMAVGGQTAGLRPTAAEWDGRSWQRLSVSASTVSVFSQVSCPTADYCVALAQDRNAADDVVIWAGVDWSAQRIPADLNLADISCVDASECFAVGADSRSQPVVEEWTGTGWVPIQVSGG